MKIELETKHQDLAKHVNEQLSFLDVDNVRMFVIIFLGMYDLPLFLGFASIFDETMSFTFLWMVSPFVLILHLWGIRLLIKNPYSTQYEMISFMGIWGLFGSISLIAVLQGMSYYTLQITSIFFYIVINLVISELSYKISNRYIYY